jgi:hypothetical protein
MDHPQGDTVFFLVHNRYHFVGQYNTFTLKYIGVTMSAIAEKGEAQYSERKVIDQALEEESLLIEAALARADEETRLGIRGIFKLYWRGAIWSMLLSLALVMEGMDVGLVNNFFGQNAYRNKFGKPIGPDGAMRVPDNWQAAINNGQQIGAIAGLLFNGWAQSKFGSRRIYMLAMVLMAAFGTPTVIDH